MKLVLIALMGLAACEFSGRDENGAGTGDSPDGGLEVDGAVAAGADAAANVPDGASATQVRLSDTDPGTPTEAGASCAGAGNGAIYDGQWYRIYDLADPHWGMTAGSVTITGARVSAWLISGSTGVTLKIGSYTGTYPTATLQPASIAQISARSVDLPDQAGGDLVEIKLAAPVTVAAGTRVVVEIDADHGVLLGATGGDAYRTGFFGSTMCAHTPPIASKSFVLDLLGMVAPL